MVDKATSTAVLLRDQSTSAGAADAGDWILRAELDLYLRNSIVELLSKEEIRALLIQRKILCGGACGGAGGEPCTLDTRLSRQRKTNLMRQKGHLFGFDNPPGQLPLNPGQTKTWVVPAYPLGRVIEELFFRPTMESVNNEPGTNFDDIWVTITGEDGVPWAQFAGGRHLGGAGGSGTGCCLLEWFEDDCIGYMEGFRVTLKHNGAPGAPAMIGAAMDWKYLYPNQRSKLNPNWCWPGSDAVRAKC